MDRFFGINAQQRYGRSLHRSESERDTDRGRNIYRIITSAHGASQKTNSGKSTNLQPLPISETDPTEEATEPEYHVEIEPTNESMSMARHPGPGVPFEFRGTEPPHSNVPRTVDVERPTWDFFTQQSLGRPSSGTFANFFQAQEEYDYYAEQELGAETERHQSIFGLGMLNPYSTRHHIWTGFINCIDATYTAFFIPFIAAFIGRSSDYIIHNTTIIEIIFGAVFLCDIFVNFHVGFVIHHDYKKKVVMDGRHVAWYYLKYGGAWIDILSVVPLFYDIGASIVLGFGDQSLAVSVLRLFRLLRVFRILKTIYGLSFTSTSVRLWFGFRAQATTVYLASVIYSMLVMMNFLGCFLFYIADVQKGSLKGTWIYKYTDAVTGSEPDGMSRDDYILNVIDDQTQLELYLTSLYWAVTTVTTVGYGDITPSSSAEMIVLIGVMLSHIMLFGLLIGSISELVKSSVKSAQFKEEYKKKMDLIGEWMSQVINCVNGVQTYYTEIRQHMTDFDEEQILDELPLSLRVEVIYKLTKELLTGLNVFTGIKESTLKKLSARLIPIVLPPGVGRELVRQGDEADALYILEKGDLMMLFNEVPVYTIQGPETCGETGILSSSFPQLSSQPVTLRTITSCTLWKLPSKDLLPMFALDIQLRDALTEGYRLRLLKSFESSTRSNGIEKKVEAEFGCKMGPVKAIRLKNRLEATKTADGSFCRLLEDVVSGIFLEYAASPQFRCSNAPSDNDRQSSLGSSKTKDSSTDDAFIGELLEKIQSEGEFGMVSFVSRLRQSSAANGRIDLDGLRQVPMIASLRARTILALFSFFDSEDVDSIYTNGLIEQLRTMVEFPETRRMQIHDLYEELVDDVKTADVANNETLTLVDLSRRYQAQTHPDVISGAISTSNALYQFMTNIDQEEITLNSFIDFHKDLSLCVASDDRFVYLTRSLWKQR